MHKVLSLRARERSRKPRVNKFREAVIRLSAQWILVSGSKAIIARIEVRS